MWNKRFPLIAGFMIILSFLYLPSAFALYQWVDESGTTHFTDYPKPTRQTADEEADSPSPASRPENPAPSASGQQLTKPSSPVKQTDKAQLPVALPTPSTISPPNKEAVKPAEKPKPAIPQSGQAALLSVPSVSSAPSVSAAPAVPASSPVASLPPVGQAAAGANAQMARQEAEKQLAKAIAAGFAGTFLLVFLGIYLYFSLCLYLIAGKLNVTAAWTAFVPLIQVWPLLGSAGKPCWWVILLCIPLVNAIVGVYLWMCISENMGKNKMLGLLALVPVANLILMGMLAFTKKEGEALPA